MSEIHFDTELDRLRAVILNMPAPVALLMGPDHLHDFVNEHYRKVSGGGRDVTGLAMREAFPELEGQGIFEALDLVFTTGEAWSQREVPARYDRDGTGLQDTWFDLSYVPLIDEHGKTRGILDYAVDVTDQVRARQLTEQLLLESERSREDLIAANDQLHDQQIEMEAQTEELQATAAQLEETMEEALRARATSVAREAEIRTLADAIPTLAWTARADGFIDWYNARWYEYTGTTPDQMEGWGWQSVHDPKELPVVFARWTEAIASGTTFEMTFPLRRSDGEFRRFLTRVTPVRDTEGRVIRWFGTNTDVEAERRAREAAEAANEAKINFLANMSHELRTPLNAIGGYAELLELGIHGPVSEQQRDSLARIQRSQRHLLGLINEVLNYAKLETGAVHYDFTEVQLKHALSAAESLIAPQALMKGINLTSDTSSRSFTVQTDPDKLQQILINLLSNAVKFTAGGGEIVTSVSMEGSSALVRVRDTGIGIPADKLESIFDPFVQVRSTLTRPHEGTGLGLAISRDLARGLGGELTVESTPGVGSTFTLMLPSS